MTTDGLIFFFLQRVNVRTTTTKSYCWTGTPDLLYQVSSAGTFAFPVRQPQQQRVDRPPGEKKLATSYSTGAPQLSSLRQKNCIVLLLIIVCEVWGYFTLRLKGHAEFACYISTNSSSSTDTLLDTYVLVSYLLNQKAADDPSVLHTPTVVHTPSILGSIEYILYSQHWEYCITGGLNTITGDHSE